MNFKANKLFYINLCVVNVFALIFIFRNYPVMGHDYSYYLPALHDFYYAFTKYGVLFLEYTSQKCSGVPVWANPSGMTFSLVHFFSLIFPPPISLVVYYVVFFSISYLGCDRFLKRFVNSNELRSVFSLAWSLQTFLLVRSFVGHMQFVTLGLLPLYAYFIFHKKVYSFKDRLLCIVPAVFLANDIYMGGANTFIISTAGLVFYFAFDVLFLKNIEKKSGLISLFLSISSAIVLAYPKLSASLDLIRNVKREVSFTVIEFYDSLVVTINILFSPFSIDYQSNAGWSFGNWEAANCLLPGMFFFLLYKLKDKKVELSNLVKYFSIFLAFGVLINWGIYAPLVKEIPILNSLHVNPRFMFVFNLTILAVIASFSSILSVDRIVIYFYPFLIILTALGNLNISTLGQPYLAFTGMDVGGNRLSYCYEPVFGYGLEKMPKHIKDSNFKSLIDPRCYLNSYKDKCDSLSTLTGEDEKLLRDYKLSL